MAEKTAVHHSLQLFYHPRQYPIPSTATGPHGRPLSVLESKTMKITRLIFVAAFIVACMQSQTIESTNRTGLDILEDVEQRIYDSMPYQPASLSIAYISKSTGSW